MQPDQIDQKPAGFDEREVNYTHNHKTFLSVLSGGRRADAIAPETGEVGIRLERILVDHVRQQPVSFEGDTGIEAVLTRLHDRLSAFDEEHGDGHLTGLVGSLISARGIIVGVRVTLGAGGQIVYEVGPCTHLAEILQAIEHLDRQLHVTTHGMGCDYDLVAEGYNPFVQAPLDVALVPRTRYTLLNAYLAQTGRYARDMMRCCCATQISLDYARGRSGIDAYRIAVALSPIFMFLTDNVRSFRFSGARRCPRMTRSLVWEEVDPARCGVVPGTFAEGFNTTTYLNWLESLRPILFTDSLGHTTSTGKRTLREVMGDRVFTGSEALGLFTTVYPNVRLGRRMELLQADSLRPRMAVGYAAFVKGIFCNPLALDSAADLIGQVTDEDVSLASYELRVRGWDAIIYGRPASQIVSALITIARNGIGNTEELALLNVIAELWDFTMVPRDAYVHQEEKAARGW